MTCPHHLSWIYHFNTLIHLTPTTIHSKKVATWIIKINIILSQNIWFLWACKSRDEDKNITSFANKHKTLTMVSLTAENISTRCSTIRGTLDEGECRIILLLPWNSFLTPALWVMKQVAYSNPTDMDSEFS
jgi:hypothetical protein